jgi:hypothetical protein
MIDINIGKWEISIALINTKPGGSYVDENYITGSVDDFDFGIHW